ncbi:MAG: hypothetical protein ACYDEQ_11240, partial [Desulfocucumaceae bacterium]
MNRDVMRFRGLNYSGEKRVNFYLAHYFGDYLLVSALIAGRYLGLGNKDKGADWMSAADVLAGIMKRAFGSLYVNFTGEKDTTIEGSVDWQLLGKQMAFFMSGEYASVLKNASLGDALAKKTFADLYPGAKITLPFHITQTRGWTKNGWMADGRNADLGPVNGPFPIQELIFANYLYATAMLVKGPVSSRNNQLVSPALMPLPAAGSPILKEGNVWENEKEFFRFKEEAEANLMMYSGYGAVVMPWLYNFAPGHSSNLTLGDLKIAVTILEEILGIIIKDKEIGALDNIEGTEKLDKIVTQLAGKLPISQEKKDTIGSAIIDLILDRLYPQDASLPGLANNLRSIIEALKQTLSLEEEITKLSSLMKDQIFIEEMAGYLKSAYNKAAGWEDVGISEDETPSGLTKKDLDIALNLAGFIGLEVCVTAFLNTTRKGQSLVKVLKDIEADSGKNQRLSPQERALISSFAHTAWKAGLPFRAIVYESGKRKNAFGIMRDHDFFAPFLSFEDKTFQDDMLQIKIAARLLVEEIEGIDENKQMPYLQRKLKDPVFLEKVAKESLKKYNWFKGTNYTMSQETTPTG